MPVALLEESGSGLGPTGPGWFVVNAGDAMWLTTEGGEKKPSGSECSFETPMASSPSSVSMCFRPARLMVGSRAGE